VTHTPWILPLVHGRGGAVPPSGPAGRHAGSGRPAPAVDAAPRPAAPTFLEPGAAGPAGDAESRPAPRQQPPAGVIRLRFADEAALERAGAAFGAGSGPGFADAWSDPATLTLQIAADAGTETLRAVLAVLDAAAVAAESLTVHTHELDDVFAAFTSLP
jgi:hypothetical protein